MIRFVRHFFKTPFIFLKSNSIRTVFFLATQCPTLGLRKLNFSKGKLNCSYNRPLGKGSNVNETNTHRLYLEQEGLVKPLYEILPGKLEDEVTWAGQAALVSDRKCIIRIYNCYTSDDSSAVPVQWVVANIWG